jgi:hypothetical protein
MAFNVYPAVSQPGKYMNEDPWISQVWMKEHPDWKAAKAGPKPEVCKD